MASITKSQALAKLNFYLDAEEKILSGQSVSEGDVSLTRANLAEVRAGRREWQKIYDGIVAAENRQNTRSRYGIWYND